MKILEGLSSPSIRVDQNETRMPNRVQQETNTFKEAFKLDINPKYLSPAETNEVKLADTDALFYDKHMDVTNKPLF